MKVKAEMAALTKTFRKVAAPAGRGQPPAAAAAPPLTPLTIKLQPAVVGRIMEEVARRKRERLPNRSIQAVVTEAVLAYLEEDAHGRRKAG